MNIIGIDGGGTKTKFALFDSFGQEIDSIVLGSCHFMQVSYAEMSSILSKGITYLCSKNNVDDIFVCAGMGGYGRDLQIREKIDNAFKDVVGENHYKIYSDAEIAVAGALGSNDGIVIIAGTGSIAFSKINHQFNRVGGWGYLLGDEGSAYWLGRKALSVFCKQSDGRLQKGALYQCFKEYFKLNEDFELINIANEKLNQRSSMASLAKVVYAAAELEDQDAIVLFEEAALEMVSLINALNKKTTNLSVSYVGGMFAAEKFIIPIIERNIDSNLQLIKPCYSPEKGAYILAKQYIENI